MGVGGQGLGVGDLFYDELDRSTVALVMKFSHLVRLLERNGCGLVRGKGSIRSYAEAGHPQLVGIDFHGAKEVPTGTCHAILKAVGVTGGS